MNSPLTSVSPQAPPFTGYGFESGRFFPQQPTPPDEIFDDENQVPSPEEFEAIVEDYLNNLSPKKRDKALVDQERYQLIQQVLRDPRNTSISTAQFRFWVKKMFQLQPGSVDLVCHDSKPVAMREQIYPILVRAHREAHHGGRDKTSALASIYSVKTTTCVKFSCNILTIVYFNIFRSEGGTRGFPRSSLHDSFVNVLSASHGEMGARVPAYLRPKRCGIM